MKRVLFAGILAGLFVTLNGFFLDPNSPVEGSWTGEFQNGVTTHSFQVHFRSEDGALKGTIDIPKENVQRTSLDWIVIDSSSIHFELVRSSGTSVFDGQLKNGRIVGDYLTSVNKGSFYLISAAVVQ